MTLVDDLLDLGDDYDLEEPEEEYDAPIGPPCETKPGFARLTPYMRAGQTLRQPRPKQRAFLSLRCLEAFYGGAAGGGKSDALLMGALQFVDVPGYAALLLRKTYEDLRLPGALIPRLESWLSATDARWSGMEKAWHFPSGAVIQFGYCNNDADVMRYRSAEFQFIGIDEVTQWSLFAYRYLFSRLRRPGELNDTGASTLDGLTLNEVPLRMRSGSNPGDVGHPWVKRRLVDPATRRGPFIPAKSDDLNGIIDVDAYLRSLREMDPVNWMRYAHGDWEIKDPGEIFDITKLRLIDECPWEFADTRRYRVVRFWDMAATEVKPGKDPDWTVGLKLALDRQAGRFCVLHVARTRAEPDRVEALMRATAEADGRSVQVHIEREPGSEGKLWLAYVRRQLLRGFSVHGEPATGDKGLRIRMLQPLVNGGDIDVVNAPWAQALLDEVDAWPHVDHDDQLDALGGAHRALTNPRSRIII